LAVALPWLVDLFGGRQSARSLHFFAATLIVLFVVVHLAMVVLSGLWNNLRSMITGRYAIETGWTFENPGPYEPPQPFTMLVEERRGNWVMVHLPVRPNGTVGWVDVGDVDLSTTDNRIEINLTERMLRAYAGSEQIAETQVVVGSPFTPTPTGTFYVTDIVPQTSPTYGPVALATNGYSEIMDKFDTGVPVVALHGTNNPQYVGQARSNGCIRVPNEIIQMLADTMPQGTPVYIFP